MMMNSMSVLGLVFGLSTVGMSAASAQDRGGRIQILKDMRPLPTRSEQVEMLMTIRETLRAHSLNMPTVRLSYSIVKNNLGIEVKLEQAEVHVMANCFMDVAYENFSLADSSNELIGVYTTLRCKDGTEEIQTFYVVDRDGNVTNVTKGSSKRK